MCERIKVECKVEGGENIETSEEKEREGEEKARSVNESASTCTCHLMQNITCNVKLNLRIIIERLGK